MTGAERQRRYRQRQKALAETTEARGERWRRLARDSDLDDEALRGMLLCRLAALMERPAEAAISDLVRLVDYLRKFRPAAEDGADPRGAAEDALLRAVAGGDVQAAAELRRTVGYDRDQEATTEALKREMDEEVRGWRRSP